jgi:flagellar biogenesis protein FliO
MSLKKLVTVLFLLNATLAHAANNKQPSPPVTEQAAPSDAPDPSSNKKSPEQMPLPLPSSTEMTNSYEGAFIRMLVTLLGILFLVFATFWILRRLGAGKFKMGSGRLINILEKRPLSPKSMLYIVEIGNKKVLIAESQVEVRALTSYQEVPEVSE